MDCFDLRLWDGFKKAGGDTSRPAIIEQVAIDSRRIHSGNTLFAALKGKTADGHSFVHDAAAAGARFILVNSHWNTGFTHPAAQLLRVDDPLEALQQIAAAYRSSLHCRTIAIAGSFGKTMVKDLLLKMLRSPLSVVASPESFNSQIGVPLSLFTVGSRDAIALIEAGISQKGEMESLASMIKPDAVIITHIGKKHLATLGDLATAANETLKILSSHPKKSWAILPRGIEPDPLSSDNIDNIYFWNENTPRLPHAYFTSDEKGSALPYRIDFPDGTCHLGKITSGFYYFLDLINITTKAAWLLNAPSASIAKALKNYTPEPMRTEIWKSPIGSTFINEPYCSDPQSIDKAIALLHQTAGANKKIFLFGGMRNGKERSENDYRKIGKAVHTNNIDQLILYGNHPYGPLLQEVSTLSPSTTTSVHPSHKEALAHLKNLIGKDDVALIKGENKLPIDEIAKTFNESISNNQCMINLAAIGENIRMLRSKFPAGTRLMVMVKALAYGTDDILMAKFLETCGVDILGVSYVDEGVALKRAGATQAIFVINAAPYEAEKVVKWDLEIGLSDKETADAVAHAAAKANKQVRTHLHINTGMGRFGCRMEDALKLARIIENSPHLILEGIMTHFACADDPAQDAFTCKQAGQLDKAIGLLKDEGINPKWRHAANSSAAIRFSFPQYNMVRIGLAVYGLHSSPAVKEALDLRLALSLVSRIVGINVCKEGDTISYGRTYKVEKKSQKIGVLPIGYFDGLHRNYSGKGSVIIRGRTVPMVGRICMDFMMVDLTDIPHASPGDPVLIFGEDEYGNYLSAEELAASGNSIIHELITCLGPRIHRIFVHEEAHRAH